MSLIANLKDPYLLARDAAVLAYLIGIVALIVGVGFAVLDDGYLRSNLSLCGGLASFLLCALLRKKARSIHARREVVTHTLNLS